MWGGASGLDVVWQLGDRIDSIRQRDFLAYVSAATRFGWQGEWAVFRCYPTWCT